LLFLTALEQQDRDIVDEWSMEAFSSTMSTTIEVEAHFFFLRANGYGRGFQMFSIIEGNDPEACLRGEIELETGGSRRE
jgi:hypothetical protein